ncbi:Vegetative incompatibility protein HET-E-1 [Rhizoctonia solani AG-1 IB]|uniref:Vegetative incompatibility protein HET-E-1 n=1 Tax=Thanatephorus cucumeris (strain AG1-IB / isolate 7/3/14) TaxID=1108050 RepID=M5C517_THACB|nr:Vegetative incompatibility protein HET-E-1 [Rhizoctonia solani AG-1 IB]
MLASYNSAESDTIKRRSCTPGTRQPQIDMLLEWARTPDSGKTCWMNGMAGTGKTTIAYTICSLLERDCQLSASFFCSRTIPECRLVKYIIPTIAYQLARFSLPFRCALGKALEQDPDAHTRALSAQYQKLIAEPLTEVQKSLPADLIVVIDALDECEGEDNVSQIMDQLLSTTDTIPIRFLVSSRPEKQIAQRMAGRLSEYDDTRLVLHDLDRSTVRTDIEAYMRAELKNVPLCDTQWPLIVDCCGELFIYASTVCRYVQNAHENRSLNEAVVVVTSSGSGPETENMIDDLYSTVLDAANNSTEMNNTDKQRMNEVLQTVLALIATWEVSNYEVGLMSLTADGTRLAAPGRGSIEVYDTATGGGAHVASGSGDRTIRVYDAHTGHTVLGPLHGHNYPVNSVIFSPDCTRLFSCSDDGTVRIWNVQYLGVSAASSMAQVGISSIRYSHSGARVVSGSYDGSIHVWDVRTSEMMLGPLRDHEGAIQCLDYSPDDQYIASGLHNNTLQIWDTSTGKVAHRPMQRHSDLVVCVRFSADGSSVVSCSYDGTVRLWDVNTGEQTKQLFNEESAITSVCISPEGHWVAFGSQGGKIRVLDVHTGNTQVGPIDAHTYCVNSVEFSPNGKRLASGSSDESVRIWDTLTGKQLAVCGDHGGSHSGPIKCVAFSPSGLYIASCSIDRTVRIWDGQSGKLVLGPLTGHTATISGVHFSPDGSHIVSCSHDATIRFWDMSSVTTSLQGYRTTSTGEEVAHSSNNDIASVLWSLDDEGWVIDSYHRRLVWVPPDLRTSLALPPTSSIIADQGYYRLETDGCMIGDNWMECYEP